MDPMKKLKPSSTPLQAVLSSEKLLPDETACSPGQGKRLHSSWCISQQGRNEICRNAGSRGVTVRVTVEGTDVPSSIYPFFFLHDPLLASLEDTESFRNNHNPLEAHVLRGVLGEAAGPPLCGLSRCRDTQRECASLLSARWCSFPFFFSFFSLRFMTCSPLLH